MSTETLINQDIVPEELQKMLAKQVIQDKAYEGNDLVLRTLAAKSFNEYLNNLFPDPRKDSKGNIQPRIIVANVPENTNGYELYNSTEINDYPPVEQPKDASSPYTPEELNDAIIEYAKKLPSEKISEFLKKCHLLEISAKEGNLDIYKVPRDTVNKYFIEPLMLDDSSAENQDKVATPYPHKKIPEKAYNTITNDLANVNARGMFEDDIALNHAREVFLNNAKDTIKALPKKELRAMLEKYKKGDI